MGDGVIYYGQWYQTLQISQGVSKPTTCLIAPLGLSDHTGLLWKFTCNVPTVHRQEVGKKEFWKGDYSSMAEILSSI